MKKEYIYAIISVILWSTTATVTKLLLGNLDSMQILLLGSLFAIILLFIVNCIKGNLKEIKNYKLKDYFKIFIIGILGTFLYNLFLYLGINTMQASQAFIINYLWPIMTVIFACLILKEKITYRKIIAIIISFVGVIIVSSNGNLLNIEKNSIIGTIYCILAAISYGLFSVLNKKQNYNKFTSMMLFYLSSFCISLIYCLCAKKTFIPETNQLLGLLWIGIFTSAIAFTSWALALENGDTARISNIAYITPFISLVWTSVILREKLSIYSIIGLIIIILGILIQMKNNKKEVEL
ncbi:MAG TPA: EamA/RhaT family transporter [Clostridiales bacterium]|nr:EamA/RhaT family transporter [Clostridiales bacterium]